MSIMGLLCLLFALVALLLLVLYALQRRERRALVELSAQLQRIAIGGRLTGRIDIATDQPELGALATSINHLLGRLAAKSEPPRVPAATLYSDIGDRVHEVVIVHREAVVYANPQFASLVGVRREDLVGRKLQELVTPDYAELVEDNIRRRLKGEPAAERYEVELIGSRGELTRLEIASALTEFDGAPALLVTGVEIIPTLTVKALSMGGTEAALAAPVPATGALESLAEAVITTDVEGRIRYANPAAIKLLGKDDSPEQLTGQRLEEIVRLVDETDRRLLADPVHQAVASGTSVRIGRRAVVMSRGDGVERSIELSASPIRTSTPPAEGETSGADTVTGAVVLLHDVTELRGLTRQMSYQATHDALTGLVNRREFEHRLGEAIDVAHRGAASHVLAYLDLDRFKVINDTSGHTAGDSMLREVAKLLRDAVRDSDIVARLGGDEFGVLLTGCPLDKARQIADDLTRTVAEYRFVWKDRLFNIGASVGLVEITRETGTLEEAFAAADSACYVAKKHGSGNVAVYSAHDEAVARQSGEIHWLQTLQSALKENRFELYWQPIVSAYGANGRGPSMEVFVRLKDDSGREISPSDFVRAAERYRLMGHIDRWVVQTTLTAVGRGAIELVGERSCAVNISGQTLSDPTFLEFVVECFDRTGADPAHICFEIAESAVVANLEHAQRFVGVLHGIGCQFALDDFGKGLGSFANLRDLPMDYLKIDGSFMRNLGRDTVNQAMVTAMIRLARTLNFKVIAEQVEDANVVDAARRMGIDYLQGYAIGRPQPLLLAA